MHGTARSPNLMAGDRRPSLACCPPCTFKLGPAFASTSRYAPTPDPLLDNYIIISLSSPHILLNTTSVTSATHSKRETACCSSHTENRRALPPYSQQLRHARRFHTAHSPPHFGAGQPSDLAAGESPFCFQILGISVSRRLEPPLDTLVALYTRCRPIYNPDRPEGPADSALLENISQEDATRTDVFILTSVALRHHT